MERLRLLQSELANHLDDDVLSEYVGSSFLKYKLCDLNFNLPKDYIVCFPITNTFGTPSERNFSYEDYLYLEHDIPVVVLGRFNEWIDFSPNVINLNKQTSVLESIEILKGASGYIGVDSFLSVLAAKLFKTGEMLIKSINPHCYRHKSTYYAPHTSFDFLQSKFSLLEE
jgi:hypothetical protein